MIFIRLQCAHCDFKRGVRRDPVPYAFWNNQAHVLRHPFEESDLAKLTKLSWDEAVSQGIVQRMNDCICLDVERVVKRCPKCESYNVKTSRASLAAECPACRLGKLESSFVAIS
jgi:hypothetical protein